ncbi:Histone-lysine N-methyltransferase atxr2 [Ancistrocladus abbreviatus]
MASSCLVDVQLANEVSALLKPCPPHIIQDYFDNLITTRQCRGLKVKIDGELGKGVYADIDFKEGELVLKDQMLVGAQHSSNKMDCLVCSFCFRFIGSVELQIGRKLYFQRLGISADDECHGGSTDVDDDSCIQKQSTSGECSTSNSKSRTPLPKEVEESLMSGELVLPYSERFSLPPVISCPGGCGEAYYCSKSCADMDWESCHSILCTGEGSMSSCKEALSRFIEHANDTNDIFLLAAKVISFTILRYRKLKAVHLKKEYVVPYGLASSDALLLLEAWKPFSMVYKRRWWDCIALPSDVDVSDEASFRMEIKQMAFMSLQLLKAAIFDKECAPLFSLDVYGHIIGMFELNNLDLVVASPVEDYFLYIDDLPQPQKQKEVETITKPALDALGDDYSICCQGTALFPLQSCMNHSCCPNAKAFKTEEDRDGQATIIALRPIQAGEEVTISYIDEELPYEERQALLADYGFRCKCPKCLEEGP